MLARGNALTMQLFTGLRGPSRAALLEPVGGLYSIETATIKAALKRTMGNVNKAAKELGVSRATIYRKIKRMHHQE